MKKIILAAGGTGGHIFPAIALAEELITRGYEVSLITDDRFSKYNNSFNKEIFRKIYYIKAGTLSGGILVRIRAVFNIIIGIIQAKFLLAKIKPNIIVGFGGYPSFPTMLAANYSKYKTIIHEQNAVLGKANRILAARANIIATSYENVALIKDKTKVKFVGNPVRAAILAINNIPYPTLEIDSLMQILVIGGSQGANIFSEIVPRAISLLPKNLQKRLRIDQQSRAEDIEKTRNIYKKMGINADIKSFFTDIPVRLAAAHLVICRSGASSVAEIICAGRPAIFVPYPLATDNHQIANAISAEDTGGAWVMPQDDFTPEALSTRLEAFLTLPNSLNNAANKIRGKSNAAKKLADIIC